MVEDVGGLTGFVLDVIASLGYVGIALLVALETFVPPIPSEVVLPAAGFLVGRGELSLVGVLLASTLGSVGGAWGLYALARRVGHARVERWVARHGGWLTLSSEDLRRAREWFLRHGAWAVLVGRLMPGIRSLVSIPAGLEGMALPRFLALTTIGSFLWNALLVLAGRGLGENWRVIGPYYERVETALWVLVGALVAWRVAVKVRAARRERRRARTG